MDTDELSNLKAQVMAIEIVVQMELYQRLKPFSHEQVQKIYRDVKSHISQIVQDLPTDPSLPKDYNDNVALYIDRIWTDVLNAHSSTSKDTSL